MIKELKGGQREGRVRTLQMTGRVYFRERRVIALQWGGRKGRELQGKGPEFQNTAILVIDFSAYITFFTLYYKSYFLNNF